MAIDNRTLNRNYRLPNIANKMGSEDLPRLILSLEMIDEDMAAIAAEVLEKADEEHEHEMGAIIGLLDALAGKAALIHNHSIGGLQGVDFSGAATNQFAKFNGSLWIPAFIQAADLANKIITNAKLRDSAALSILGRAAASVGSPADISATTNDRLLARVADAIVFVQLTLGMVPDELLTFSKLASGAIADQSEAEVGAAADKLMTPQRTAQAIAAMASAQAVKITEFTSGGTYTKDAEARFVWVQAQGGGGGGGGSAAASSSIGGEGSPGAYASAFFAAADVGATETITVGAAGSGGSTGPGSGGAGGQSSFGSKVIAPGGKGGSPGNGSTGASAGAAGLPTISVAGFGNVLSVGVPSIITPFDNRAPSSFMGIGGERVSTANGAPGIGYGAPGGGGARGSSGTARSGGAGAPGVVIITEFF